MNLFDHHREAQIDAEAPLAARRRPRTLDELVRQEVVVEPGRWRRRDIQADQLSSLILYGSPGTGKTALARIIADTTSAQFIALNAVLAAVTDIREAIAPYRRGREEWSQGRSLFSAEELVRGV